MQAPQASVSKSLSDGYRVGVVSSLASKIASTEADALAVDKVDGGNNIHGSSCF